MYEVVVLKEGYCEPLTPGSIRAGGTITLLKGASNIVVDTGSAWDKDVILKGLSSKGLTPDDIQYLVCSHGHSDHVGNNNLFQNALHIVGFDICRRDQYILHDFKKGIPYEIDEDIEVVPTPGHTGQDVSVMVRRTNLGTVAVVGDLFECEADLECPSLWQENSEVPLMQEQCRIEVLRDADWIVPGHGPMFAVPKECKKQLRVVMLCEESVTVTSMGSCSSSSKSECIIVETE